MKRSRLKLILLSLFLAPLAGFAQELSLASRSQTLNSALSIHGNYTQFALQNGTINGTGLRAGYTHYLTEKIGAEVFLATALQTSGVNSFTGYGMSAHYTLFSPCCALNREVQLNGETQLRERVPTGFKLQVGAGLNQYLFNGTNGVYSLSGPGLLVQSIYEVWGLSMVTGVQYITLSNGTVKATGMGFFTGLTFPL